MQKSKEMKKIVKIQSYISKDDNDALERIVRSITSNKDMKL